jgi:hypothetical protein
MCITIKQKPKILIKKEKERRSYFFRLTYTYPAMTTITIATTAMTA